eukprot:CAMPEP_0170731496 /NCGR_PEP_ID=MMETSP0437-20130122/1075_1 /TAXON_ID=0 /ORGANISM="Sexangularia sp." /LENGTH=229 /DNA_ID=CAMNT_0011069721 /DNA_START=45 /DNA_END=734 /DNA_ORIENTATION=-
MSTSLLNKKRKFVADGVFYAELNEYFSVELAEEGYSGVEVRQSGNKVELIIRATRTKDVLGEKGRRIRELTSAVCQRFNFKEGQCSLFAERVEKRGLCAVAQAESLKYKLLGGLPVRRAAYGVVRFIRDAGARGCEVIVTGKLRAQRAKAMKFLDGYMIKTGQPKKDFVDIAVRHVMLKQGVLGVKVSIMLPDGEAKKNDFFKEPERLPDTVLVKEPKRDEDFQPAVIV